MQWNVHQFEVCRKVGTYESVLFRIGEWNRMMDQRGPKEHAIRALDQQLAE